MSYTLGLKRPGDAFMPSSILELNPSLGRLIRIEIAHFAKQGRPIGLIPAVFAGSFLLSLLFAHDAQAGPPSEELRALSKGELPQAGTVFSDCQECPEMVVLPPGSFLMGSSSTDPERVGSLEEPQHEVSIGYSFAVSKFEITWDQWEACQAGGGCTDSDAFDEGWGKGDRPVNNISWQAALTYVFWLQKITGQPYRLLSEAEWEYAARAGTTTSYSLGDSISSSQANFNGSGADEGEATEEFRQKTMVAGSFPANAFGLHDMHGNLWEWTEDCWVGNYIGAPSDGSARESGDCTHRVLRGGSYSSGARVVRSANRSMNTPDAQNNAFGFRVARSF